MRSKFSRKFTWTQTDTRLAKSGLPLLLSSAVLLAVPVLGRRYLSVDDYAAWALLLTILVSGFILDFGGVHYVQSAGYGRTVPKASYLRAMIMTWAGAGTVASCGWVAWSLLQPALNLRVANQPMGLLILSCGLAGGIRGTWGVVVARFQVAERFAERGALALVQAAAQVAICWVMLAYGFRLWALPVSLAVSCAAGSLCGLLMLAWHRDRLPQGPPPTSARRFAVMRATAALIGVVSSQSDRWLLGLIATPSFLADYDFANRMATLPVSVGLTLFAGLVAEVAAVEEPLARHALAKRAVQQLSGFLVVGSAIDIAILLALGGLNVVPISLQVFALFGLVLFWVGINGLTGPITMAFLGIGQPGAELRYALPCLLTSCLGWGLAVALGQPWLLLGTTMLSVVAWSIWFVVSGLRLLRHGGARQAIGHIAPG